MWSNSNSSGSRGDSESRSRPSFLEPSAAVVLQKRSRVKRNSRNPAIQRDGTWTKPLNNKLDSVPETSSPSSSAAAATTAAAKVLKSDYSRRSNKSTTGISSTRRQVHSKMSRKVQWHTYPSSE